MTVRKRKSKKRSAANSRPPDNPVFFIDEALGRHLIPDALKAAGEPVEAHNDILPSGTPDTEWLEYAGRNKRLVITKDKRIRHRSAEIEMIKDCNTKVFRFASGNLRGQGNGGYID
jgi:predicted nuclease of predicted toxin-antitoxin system